ncbi:hypothetical protein [Streptomyces decoyicus]|uniref:pPIWI_RE_Z domain-containing protein n=1 Tax=Streptomyces decoyicus TaxID=249567 RepID=UPI000A7EAE45|nr:hypothetical protein [Streptomyces decoyicus]QZY15140.1 hypothetical protein K7C20_07650 [Streptomyces decoyicus]
MAREVSAWSDHLVAEAKATGADALMQPLAVGEFFRLELGLFFLMRHMPGQSATVLRKVLDGYLIAGEETEPLVRNLRRRMGPTARSGQWRIRLNEYCKLPAHLRMFELESPSGRRVVSGSVFLPRGSALLPGREDAYRAALRDPVEYELRTVREPASPGAALWFRRRDNSTATLRVPDWVDTLREPARLHPRSQRARAPFPDVTEDDARQAAKEMDLLLRDDPRYCREDFSGRLENMVFAQVDREAGQLREGLGVFSIDGVAHVVGLMNAGKTTFNDILVKIAVDRGLKVGYLVSSVGNALAKVRFFKALGIRAVPLIGRSTRAEHVARYWDDLLYATNQGQVADLPSEADAAAEFTTDLCPLETLLDPSGPVAEPLAGDERPCRDTLHVTGAKKNAKLVDCPLLSVCPAQTASRGIPDAQVWVATPAALLAGGAEPATYTARWITAAQHELDFLVVDEADQVMSQFDTKFLHHEPLTHPDGWSSRSAVAWHDGLARTWYRPIAHKHGQRYQQYSTYHSQALAGLLPLLMLPSGDSADAKAAGNELLAEIVEEGPFSGHTLLTQLARVLHGIESRSEREEHSALWEKAEQYFEEHFAELTLSPFDAPPKHLAPLIDTMTAGYTAEQSAQEAAEVWLNKYKPPQMPAHLEQRQGELARLLLAGCWSTRVTTSFFELSAMQEALQALMPLGETGSILAHQPHPELRALVPELPMGNMMALQWTPSQKDSSGSLDVVWLRGVGRWLLYHLHDMLACEGVEGPNVLLSSATSCNPHSARYHIDILPSLILREPPKCTQALRESRLLFRPRRRPGHERGVYVSGAGGREARQEAVRVMTDAVCTPDPGASLSLLEQVRQGVDEDRRQALFVVLSTQDAETSAHYMNTRTDVRALHVVPDKRAPGPQGLSHRRLGDFPATGADVLVAPEGSVGRGHNMLNDRGVAAVCPIFYLARLHPPASDLSFPLAVLNSQAMTKLLNPYRCDLPGANPAREVRALVHGARTTWATMMGRPMTFRTMTLEYLRRAFVADLLSSLYQTGGRGIRGNVPVRIYLLDAAFAPRAADPRERALDTERTSVLVAGRQLMRELLTDPGPHADADRRVKHQIHTAVWGLLGNLFETMDWG